MIADPDKHVLSLLVNPFVVLCPRRTLPPTVIQHCLVYVELYCQTISNDTKYWPGLVTVKVPPLYDMVLPCNKICVANVRVVRTPDDIVWVLL